MSSRENGVAEKGPGLNYWILWNTSFDLDNSQPDCTSNFDIGNLTPADCRNVNVRLRKCSFVWTDQFRSPLPLEKSHNQMKQAAPKRPRITPPMISETTCRNNTRRDQIKGGIISNTGKPKLHLTLARRIPQKQAKVRCSEILTQRFNPAASNIIAADTMHPRTIFGERSTK